MLYGSLGISPLTHKSRDAYISFHPSRPCRSTLGGGGGVLAGVTLVTKEGNEQK